MSLQQLLSQKKTLKATTTVVRDSTGRSYVENSQGQQLSNNNSPSIGSTGFILSDQPTDEIGDISHSDIEFDYHKQLGAPTQNELQQFLKWKSERGNGLHVTRPHARMNVGVFVLEKKPNESHYDAFAFLLSQANVYQLDRAEILKEESLLDKMDIIIFPGGVIFDVEVTLGEKAAQKIIQQIHSRGLGFFGVCAGAFLAAAEGYDRCQSEKKIVGAQTACQMGVGKVKVDFTVDGKQFFGSILKEIPQDFELFWANGPIFSPVGDQKNRILDVVLEKPSVLAQIKHFEIDKKHIQPSRFSSCILSTSFGKGNVFVCGAHPEASGLEWKPFVIHAIEWCAQKK